MVVKQRGPTRTMSDESMSDMSGQWSGVEVRGV